MKKLISIVLTVCFLLSMLIINTSAVNMVTTDDVYYWPVPDSTFLTSYCGVGGHLGLDITTVLDNTKIVAARSGEVTVARPSDCEHINAYGKDTCNGGCGNYVIIRHDDGSVGKYFHFKYATICVTAGQRVEAGDMLGIMGSSGNSTGTHLHFQINNASNVLVNNNIDVMDYAFSKEYLTLTASYELWQAGAAYNVRAVPSVSGEKVGMISNRTFVAVTEWKNVDGTNWAKILFTAPKDANVDFKDCWIALDEESMIKKVNISGGKSLPIEDDTDTEIDTDTETDTEVIVEKWLIDDNTKLRIRSGAGLSYTTVGYLSGGETVAVTEVKESDGYTWGKIDNINNDSTYKGNWCSLDYATKIGVKGDINNDNKLDIVDVVLARANIIGTKAFTTAQKNAGDMNSDGKISIVDVVMMRSAIVNR